MNFVDLNVLYIMECIKYVGEMWFRVLSHRECVWKWKIAKSIFHQWRSAVIGIYRHFKSVTINVVQNDWKWMNFVDLYVLYTVTYVKCVVEMSFRVLLHQGCVWVDLVFFFEKIQFPRLIGNNFTAYYIGGDPPPKEIRKVDFLSMKTNDHRHL